MKPARWHLVMGVALLVMGVAEPSLAQTPGDGLIIDSFNNGTIYINGTQCTSTTDSREFLWTVTAGTVTTGGVFRMYASNVQPTLTLNGSNSTVTTGGVITCFTASNAYSGTNVTAGPINPVGASIPDVIATAGDNEGFATYDLGQFAAQSGLTITTNNNNNNNTNTNTNSNTNNNNNNNTSSVTTCPDGSNIYICVNFFPYAAGTTNPQATPTAYALGTIILSTAPPGTPTDVTVGVGDTRLYATWTAPSGAASYQVQSDVLSASASSVCNPTPTSSPAATSQSTFGTAATITGLVDGTPYCVWVTALSAAGTSGIPSTGVAQTPQVVDNFWQLYGGRERGGCGGLAGPLALLGAAGALALMRRRRETR